MLRLLKEAKKHAHRLFLEHKPRILAVAAVTAGLFVLVMVLGALVGRGSSGSGSGEGAAVALNQPTQSMQTQLNVQQQTEAVSSNKVDEERMAMMADGFDEDGTRLVVVPPVVEAAEGVGVAPPTDADPAERRNGGGGDAVSLGLEAEIRAPASDVETPPSTPTDVNGESESKSDSDSDSENESVKPRAEPTSSDQHPAEPAQEQHAQKQEQEQQQQQQQPPTSEESSPSDAAPKSEQEGAATPDTHATDDVTNPTPKSDDGDTAKVNAVASTDDNTTAKSNPLSLNASIETPTPTPAPTPPSTAAESLVPVDVPPYETAAAAAHRVQAELNHEGDAASAEIDGGNKFGAAARSRISRIIRVRDTPDADAPNATITSSNNDATKGGSLVDQFDRLEQAAQDRWLSTNYTQRALDKRFRAGMVDSEGVFQSALKDGSNHTDSNSMRDVTIVWDFGAGGCTGWGLEATNMVLSLVPYVGRFGIIAGRNSWCPGLDPSSLQILEGLRRQPVDTWDIDIWISHKPPQRYPKWPYRGLTYIKREPLFIIGRSMTETHRIPSSWVRDIARLVDEVWIPSKHSVHAFTGAGVNPAAIQLIPEPIDESLFDPHKTKPMPLPGKRAFNFLSSFKLEPRKGWKLLVKAWMEEFSANDDVALYLHTYLFNDPDPRNARRIRSRIKRYVNTLEFAERDLDARPLPFPNLHVLSDEIPTYAMPSLYKACQAFVLPTHGEGWGLPMMEAMAMGLPTISTNWGGCKEFMKKTNSYLLPIERFEDATGVDFEPGAKWAVASLDALKAAMRHLVQHPDHSLAIGARARSDVVNRFNRHAVAERMLQRLDELKPIIEDRRRMRSEGRKIVRGAHLHTGTEAPTVPTSALDSNPDSPSQQDAAAAAVAGLMARKNGALEEARQLAEQGIAAELEQARQESNREGWRPVEEYTDDINAPHKHDDGTHTLAKPQQRLNDAVDANGHVDDDDVYVAADGLSPGASDADAERLEGGVQPVAPSFAHPLEGGINAPDAPSAPSHPSSNMPPQQSRSDPNPPDDSQKVSLEGGITPHAPTKSNAHTRSLDDSDRAPPLIPGQIGGWKQKEEREGKLMEQAAPPSSHQASPSEWMDGDIPPAVERQGVSQRDRPIARLYQQPQQGEQAQDGPARHGRRRRLRREPHDHPESESNRWIAKLNKLSQQYQPNAQTNTQTPTSTKPHPTQHITRKVGRGRRRARRQKREKESRAGRYGRPRRRRRSSDDDDDY